MTTQDAYDLIALRKDASARTGHRVTQQSRYDHHGNDRGNYILHSTHPDGAAFEQLVPTIDELKAATAAYGTEHQEPEPSHPDPNRATAYDWHGGGGSPMYAYASTGTIADHAALLAEIDHDIAWCEQNPDAGYPNDPAADAIALEQLRAYVLEQQRQRQEEDAIPF